MYGAIRRWSARALGILTLAGAIAVHPSGAFAQPPYPHETDLIEVMFDHDAQVRLRGGALVDLAAGAAAGAGAMAGASQVLAGLAWHEWERGCPVSEARLDQMQAEGQRRTGEPVYNLNNLYRLRVPPGVDVWALGAELEALPGILLARPVPLPQRPPVPNYEPNQGYLDPAWYTPTGVDFRFAWSLPGGNGTGVTICDLEYSWNYNHDDIGKALGSQINTNVGDPFSNNNHGTAVIGAMVADNNGWGVTGASYGASLLTCGTYYGTPTPSWNVPGAIALAVANLSAGDVIVLENQWDYTSSSGFVPIEWWLNYSPSAQSYNGVYAAIVNAVANGIHVVEAGGNGYLNTDAMTWYGNSGAIVVGAGGVYAGGTWTEGNLQKLSFSSYGSRFDLQGWGENVYTTGYGWLYNAEGVNRYYRADFDGTSSATPVVASAVASLVGYWYASVSATPPTPAYVRTLLTSTGTPQVTPPAGNIGPRPDLQAAISAIPAPSAWTDVTPTSLAGSTNSKGVAWGDFDGDGDPDLYVTRVGQANRLLRNDTGAFNEVLQAVLQDFGQGAGAAWGDLEGDGDLDLYFANFSQPNKLIMNLGAGVFADATMPPVDDLGDGTSTTWVDHDVDGDMDLYVANYNGQPNRLLQNDGSGNFVDATLGPLGNPTQCLSMAWGDYDNDGDPDLYLANYNNQPNQLLRNEGAGIYTDLSAFPVWDPFNGTSTAWGDYDNDGDLDLYVVNYTGHPNRLFRNDGSGVFVDRAFGVAADLGSGMSAAWGDYDNDGDLDLYLANNPGANKLLRNDGGTFVDDTSGPLADAGNGQGVAWADYDGDGDLDLVLANYSGVDRLLRNDIGNGNHWLHVDLVGQTSNTFGVGARIQVWTGGAFQMREVGTGAGYCGQNSLTEEFGLGSRTTVDSVVVQWPSGSRQVQPSVAADQKIAITEAGPVGVGDPARPSAFRLHACAPNPARPVTALRYDLPEPAPVSVRVFDTGGRLVRVLAAARAMPAGRHEIRWNGTDAAGRTVAPGVYFLRLDAGASRGAGRVLVLP